MNKYIIKKDFKDLTEVEKMILSIKAAAEEIKKIMKIKNFMDFL